MLGRPAGRAVLRHLKGAGLLLDGGGGGVPALLRPCCSASPGTTADPADAGWAVAGLRRRAGAAGDGGAALPPAHQQPLQAGRPHLALGSGHRACTTASSGRSVPSRGGSRGAPPHAAAPGLVPNGGEAACDQRCACSKQLSCCPPLAKHTVANKNQECSQTGSNRCPRAVVSTKFWGPHIRLAL